MQLIHGCVRNKKLTPARGTQTSKTLIHYYDQKLASYMLGGRISNAIELYESISTLNLFSESFMTRQKLFFAVRKYI